MGTVRTRNIQESSIHILSEGMLDTKVWLLACVAKDTGFFVIECDTTVGVDFRFVEFRLQTGILLVLPTMIQSRRQNHNTHSNPNGTSA